MRTDIEPRGALFSVNTLTELDIQTDTVRRRLADLFARWGYRESFATTLGGISQAVAQIACTDAQREEVRADALAIVDRVELAAAQAARPLRGAAQCVMGLYRRGFPLGLFTGLGRACLSTLVVSIGVSTIPWATAFTRDDVVGPMPQPLALSNAARNLFPQGDRVTVYVVCATPEEILASHEANRSITGIDLRAVGVSWGRRAAEASLRAARPSLVVDHLEALVQHIAPDRGAR